MAIVDRDESGKITSHRFALARTTTELGAACEYHDLEGYGDAIRETAFAALDLARYREISGHTEPPQAENDLQHCCDRFEDASAAYRASDFQHARKALALASVHLDRYLQFLGPQFADLREDLLPLITSPGSERLQH